MAENQNTPEEPTEDQHETTPEVNNQKQPFYENPKVRIVLIVLALGAVLALALWMILPGDEEEDPSTSTPQPTATQSPQVEGPTFESEYEPGRTESDPEEGELAPEDHDEEAHGAPPYVKGTEYAMTEEAQKEWRPVRAKFIQGLIGEGNIAEAVEGTATSEVIAELESQKDGAFKDSIPEEMDTHATYDEEITPYDYTENIRTESGRWISVTISYATTEDGKNAWLVSGYKVQASNPDDGWDDNHSHEDEGTTEEDHDH